MATGADTIAGRLLQVRERIQKAADRAGRRADEVVLVGVSKTFPAEAIGEAFTAGVRHFGENRIQEWELKVPYVAELGATWHLVGHLQRNKTARATALFHRVDSLDSLPLAEKLERAANGCS
jgi:PLP dependent protein